MVVVKVVKLGFLRVERLAVCLVAKTAGSLVQQKVEKLAGVWVA